MRINPTGLDFSIPVSERIYASSQVLRRWRMSGHTKDELYNKQESNYENIPIGPPSPDSH